jgi:hypothetical protein
VLIVTEFCGIATASLTEYCPNWKVPTSVPGERYGPGSMSTSSNWGDVENPHSNVVRGHEIDENGESQNRQVLGQSGTSAE